MQTHEVLTYANALLKNKTDKLQQTEDVGLKLRHAGFKVHEYHAGMSIELRTTAQENFMTSKTDIVSKLATGISRPSQLTH